MRELQLAGTEAYIRWLDLPGDDPGAPVRVYVHGLGCTGPSDFAAVVARPALRGSRSLVVDLLGHGLSDRPRDFGYRMEDQAAVLAELLDHEGLRDVDLVGHSMGGAVAIRLAAARPDLVARLVVAEPNLYPGGGAFSTPVARQTEEGFVREGHARMLAEQAPDYAARVRLADPVALHRSAVALVEGSVPSGGELLTALDRPRAFLVGEHSRPDAEADAMAAAGVPVFEVPRAGHNMLIENPDGFAETLVRALAGARAAKGHRLPTGP
ncbi:alpha/beta hydrolase [Streptomyces sp. HUAS MG47]|uniref:alpha/beta fold hydrolase n=1 Tax=Streptomyces solicamelliae TaxID=3231716 RepID=UPI0038781C99